MTFSEAIDAASVVPSKIHLRERGSGTGGVTLTAAELGTAPGSETVSFTLTPAHLEAVAGMATPELTIEPGAVQDASGNPIVATFDVSTASFIRSFGRLGAGHGAARRGILRRRLQDVRGRCFRR